MQTITRYSFLSYSGVKLPLKLVTPLEPGELKPQHFFRAQYERGRAHPLMRKDGLVGEVELAHRYEYGANGLLARGAHPRWATTILPRFFSDENGAPLRG